MADARRAAGQRDVDGACGRTASSAAASAARRARSRCRSLSCVGELAEPRPLVGRRAAERLQQRRHQPALAARDSGRGRAAEVRPRVPAPARSCSNCCAEGVERLESRQSAEHPRAQAVRGRLAERAAGLGVARRALASTRKRRRARDGEVGEALAIERDAGGLQAGDQLTVGQAVLARRGVDPHDPQAAEIALLAPAADERVLERRVDRLLRGAVELALGLVEPLARASSFLRLARRTVPRLTLGIVCSDVSGSTSVRQHQRAASSDVGRRPTTSTVPRSLRFGCVSCW